MKKLCSVICGKYRKLEKPKMSLVLSVICSKYKYEDEKIFKEDKSIEILKTLGLIENVYLKIWWKKNKLRS